VRQLPPLHEPTRGADLVRVRVRVRVRSCHRYTSPHAARTSPLPSIWLTSCVRNASIARVESAACRNLRLPSEVPLGMTTILGTA
jgi:hypothetical protein